MPEPKQNQELASYKKMITDLAPDALKIAKQILKPKRARKDRNGQPVKAKVIPPKTVDFARHVLEQYGKLVLPVETDSHEFHIINHAELAQIEKANAIVQEINQYNRLKSRGLDNVEPN